MFVRIAERRENPHLPATRCGRPLRLIVCTTVTALRGIDCRQIVERGLPPHGAGPSESGICRRDERTGLHAALQSGHCGILWATGTQHPQPCRRRLVSVETFCRDKVTTEEYLPQVRSFVERIGKAEEKKERTYK